MPEHVARRFHAVRKGVDVRLGKEHLAATSQSDNARHGFVPRVRGGHDEAAGKNTKHRGVNLTPKTIRACLVSENAKQSHRCQTPVCTPDKVSNAIHSIIRGV